MQLPFTENRISVFPQHQLCPDKNHYINCMKHIDSTKNGHFFGKLVLRNNLGQHHLYITKPILTNFTTKKRKDNVSVLEHDLNFVLH